MPTIGKFLIITKMHYSWDKQKRMNVRANVRIVEDIPVFEEYLLHYLYGKKVNKRLFNIGVLQHI